MKERSEEHRRPTGLGHRLLPPFATKGRGENLLKVISRERKREREKKRAKGEGDCERSPQIRFSFPFLRLLVLAKVALRGSGSRVFQR